MVEQLNSTLELAKILSKQLQGQSIPSHPQNLYDLLIAPSTSWLKVFLVDLQFPLDVMHPKFVSSFCKTYNESIISPLEHNIQLKSQLLQDLHLFQAFLAVKLFSDIIVKSTQVQLDEYFVVIEEQLNLIKEKRKLQEKTLGLMISMILGGLSSRDTLQDTSLLLRLFCMLLPHLSLTASFKDLSHHIFLRVQAFLSQQTLLQQLNGANNRRLCDYLLISMIEISKILLQSQNLMLLKAFLESQSTTDSWIHQEYNEMIKLQNNDNKQKDIDYILGYSTQDIETVVEFLSQNQQLRKIENELRSHLGSNKNIREVILETRNIQHSQIGEGTNSFIIKNQQVSHQGQIQKSAKEIEDGANDQIKQQVTVIQQKQALIALIDSYNQENQQGFKEFQVHLDQYLNLANNQGRQVGKSEYLNRYLQHLKILLELIAAHRQEFETQKGQKVVQEIMNNFTLDQILNFIMSLHNQQTAKEDDFQYLRKALELKSLANFDMLHLLSYIDTVPESSKKFQEILCENLKSTDFHHLLPLSSSDNPKSLLIALIQSTHAKNSSPFYQALSSQLQKKSEEKVFIPNPAHLLEHSVSTDSIDKLSKEFLINEQFSGQQKQNFKNSRVESYLKKQRQQRQFNKEQSKDKVHIKDYQSENTKVSDVLGIYKKDKDSNELRILETLVKIGVIKETDQYQSEIEINQSIVDQMISSCEKIKASEFKLMVKDVQQFYKFVALKLLKDQQTSIIYILIDAQLSEQDVQQVFQLIRDEKSQNSILVAKSLLIHHQDYEWALNELNFIDQICILGVNQGKYWNNLQIHDSSDLIKQLIMNMDLKSLQLILKIHPDLSNMQFTKSFVIDSCLNMENSQILLDLLDQTFPHQISLQVFIQEELGPFLFSQLPSLSLLSTDRSTQFNAQKLKKLAAVTSLVLARYPQFELTQFQTIDIHLKLFNMLCLLQQEIQLLQTDQDQKPNWIIVAKSILKNACSNYSVKSQQILFDMLYQIANQILKDQNLSRYIAYQQVKEKIKQAKFKEAKDLCSQLQQTQSYQLYINKILKFIRKIAHKEDGFVDFNVNEASAEIQTSYIALRHLYNSKNLDVERMVTSDFVKVRKELSIQGEGIQLVQNPENREYKFEVITQQNIQRDLADLEQSLIDIAIFNS